MIKIEKNGCIIKDLPIGQDFMCHGKILTVVEHPEEAGCAGCFFYWQTLLAFLMHERYQRG